MTLKQDPIHLNILYLTFVISCIIFVIMGLFFAATMTETFGYITLGCLITIIITGILSWHTLTDKELYKKKEKSASELKEDSKE